MRKIGGCALAAVAAVLTTDLAGADTLVAGPPADLFEVGDVATGLTQPTSFAFLPDGRLVITEKGGTVRIATPGGASAVAGTFPVNTTSEQGLLNVLVHPDFATNRLLIFYYSASAGAGGTNTDRHRVVTVPLGTDDQIDRTQEVILVRGLRGPANHDGGALAIGPDGKLYIGVGDTGSNSNKAPEPPYTPTNYFATCLTNGNGKILRVNLDGSIPSDNPLVGQMVSQCGTTTGTDPTTLPLAAAREDIWAWGFRNPWRFSFDERTGNLWVGDVGEITYEELDVIPPAGGGHHYGWPYREGPHGHPVDICRTITPDTGDCRDPQYHCKAGTPSGGLDGNCDAITGGVIVDSCTFPEAFRGRYFFGDSSHGWIATLTPDAARTGVEPGPRADFITNAGAPVHFLVGPDRALYYATIGNGAAGRIARVAPKAPLACSTPDAGGAGGTTATDGGTSSGGVASGGAASGGAASGGAGAGGTPGSGAAPATGGSAAGGSASGGATSGGATGAGGAAGGGATGAPDASAGGAPGGAAASSDSGGCGCRVGEPRSSTPQALVGALGLLALAARRRRR